MVPDRVNRTQIAFMERCASIDGAALGEGAFSPGPAIWVGRREVAHFDADGPLDVRLTRGVIRERRSELRAEDRVSLRPSQSDWIEVSITTDADADHAFALVADAVAANRPTASPGPPPKGAELARRRRFH